MNKIHTISIEDFKENPIVERILASSTGPVYKRLFVRVNTLTNIVDYWVEYKDGSGAIHSSLQSAIDTYNSK